MLKECFFKDFSQKLKKRDRSVYSPQWVEGGLLLMICVIAGVSGGAIACRRVDSMGSRRQVVGWLERKSLDVN